MSGNLTHLDDHELVEEIAERNMEAMKELLDRYADIVTLMSYRILCDHLDSVWVTREVFLDVCQRPRLHGRKISVQLWILKKLVYRCRKQLFLNRFAELFRRSQSLFVSSRPKVDDMDDYVTTQAWEVFCRACLGTTAMQRIIYSLYELGGFSDEDITLVTGVHKRGIYLLIGSMRKRIRMELAKFKKAGKYAHFVNFLKKVRDQRMDNEKIKMEILYLCRKFHRP